MQEFIEDTQNQKNIIAEMEQRLGISEEITEEAPLEENVQEEIIEEEKDHITKAIEEYNAIDWESLQDNPDKLEEELRRFDGFIEEMQGKTHKEKQQHLHVTLESKALSEKMGWETEEVATEEKKAIYDYLSTQGLSNAQISAINDHKYVMLAHKAMLYDNAVNIKEKSASKPKIPSFEKPGRVGKTNDAYKQKMKKLRRTGSLEDAAALLRDVF